MGDFYIAALKQGDIVWGQLDTMAGKNIRGQNIKFRKVFHRRPTIAFSYLFNFAFGFGQVDYEGQIKGLGQVKCLF